MLRGWVCIALAVAGCGRIHFGPVGDDGNGTGDGGADDDAIVVDAGLDAFAPFGAPQALTDLNSASNEDDPTFVGDELEVFFESNRAGTSDVYVATRTSLQAAWTVPVIVTDITSTGDEFCPKVSADGLTLYFASTRTPNLGVIDFWVTTRPTRASPWAAPTYVPELSSAMNDCSATVSPSGLEVLVHRGPNGAKDLLRATRPTTASVWGTPVVVAELSTAPDDGEPQFDGDLTVWFDSARSGDYDLYVATRPSNAQPWGMPVPVPDLNSAANDFDPWPSPDGHRIYFSSTRSGNSDLYVANR